jgi:hypothetical protein
MPSANPNCSKSGLSIDITFYHYLRRVESFPLSISWELQPNPYCGQSHVDPSSQIGRHRRYTCVLCCPKFPWWPLIRKNRFADHIGTMVTWVYLPGEPKCSWQPGLLNCIYILYAVHYILCSFPHPRIRVSWRHFCSFLFHYSFISHSHFDFKLAVIGTLNAYIGPLCLWAWAWWGLWSGVTGWGHFE